MRFIRYYLRPAGQSIIDIGCGVRSQELVGARLHICVEPFEQYVRELLLKCPDTPMRVIIQATAQDAARILLKRSADVSFLPEAISEGVAVFQERPDAVVAHPDWVVIDGDSNTMSHREVPEDDYVSMVKQHRLVVGPGVFLQKEAAKIEHGLDPEFSLVGWSDFRRRLGLHGAFARVPETLPRHATAPPPRATSVKPVSRLRNTCG